VSFGTHWSSEKLHAFLSFNDFLIFIIGFTRAGTNVAGTVGVRRKVALAPGGSELVVRRHQVGDVGAVGAEHGGHAARPAGALRRLVALADVSAFAVHRTIRVGAGRQAGGQGSNEWN